MSAQIKLRRDTAANWTSVNPILSGGINIKSLALALAAAMA